MEDVLQILEKPLERVVVAHPGVMLRRVEARLEIAVGNCSRLGHGLKPLESQAAIT